MLSNQQTNKQTTTSNSRESDGLGTWHAWHFTSLPVKLAAPRCQGTRQGEDQGRPGSRVWRKHWRPTTSHPLRTSNLPQTESSFSSRRSEWYKRTDCLFVCLLVGCLTSQQHASVSQGRICSDNFTCCHTEIEAAYPTFYLTQSQYTDTRPTSPSTDPITPGAWQGSHWSANFWVTGMIRPRKHPGASGIRTRDLPLSRWTPYH